MTDRTYRMEEIARLTGLTPRAVRYYIELGLVPGPDQRSVATVYTHQQLVLLQAIPLLRKREKLRLAAVKKRLSNMTFAEIEALVSPPAPPRPNTAPGEQPTSYLRVRWDHVELIPGLELRVREGAGAIVRRLAEEIFTRYAANAAPPANETAVPAAPGGTSPASPLVTSVAADAESG